MNERIFELMLEAGKTISGDKHIDADFCEKFAELIVGECLEIVEDEDDGSADTKSVRWAMIRIKKHFGHFGNEE